MLHSPPTDAGDGERSREGGRQSPVRAAPSAGPGLYLLAQLALDVQAAEQRAGTDGSGDEHSAQRGTIRKLVELEPDGTPRTERVVRSERRSRAGESIQRLNLTAAGARPSNAPLSTGGARAGSGSPDAFVATTAGDPPLSATGEESPPRAGPAASDPRDEDNQYAPAFIPASALPGAAQHGPQPDETWPSLQDSAASSRKLQQARALAKRPIAGRAGVAQALQPAAGPRPPPPPLGANVGRKHVPFQPKLFKAPFPLVRPDGYEVQDDFQEAEEEEEVWKPYTQTFRTDDVDSLAPSSAMDVSRPQSRNEEARHTRRSPPPSPVSASITQRRRDRHRATETATSIARAIANKVQDEQDSRRRYAREPTPLPWAPDQDDEQRALEQQLGIEQNASDGLSDFDDEDMFVDEPTGATPAPDARFSDDEDDLANQEPDEDCLATEEERAAAGQIDPIFENTRIPIRAGPRTNEVFDGMSAGEMWEGVDPSVLSEWNKIQSPSFGIRVHSVDGDTNIADIDKVHLNVDLQNTIRNTRPGSQALLAPGRAAPGSPAVEPGLFLAHEVSRDEAKAWTARQFYHVGRYCLIIFKRIHGDSTFVGTWAESTMSCGALAAGFRARFKNATKVRAVFKALEKDFPDQGKRAYQMLHKNLNVRPLSIIPRNARGNEVVEYNVYTGSITYEVQRDDGVKEVVSLAGERRRQLHEALLELSIPDAYLGAAVRRNLALKQYSCPICKAKSHPRGKCPALTIPTWGKSLRKPKVPRPPQAKAQPPTAASSRRPPPSSSRDGPSGPPPLRLHRPALGGRGRPGRAG